MVNRVNRTQKAARSGEQDPGPATEISRRVGGSIAAHVLVVEVW
jgi:hypothetical protein